MRYYIDSYIILNKKIGLTVYVYIMIIIVITLSLTIFLTLFKYKTYYKVKGIVEKVEDDFYIRLYIPLEDISYITENTFVIINNKKYKYTINSIFEEYITDNFNTYQMILIKVNIPSKYRFNNLSLELQLLKENKRVIDYIIRR